MLVKLVSYIYLLDLWDNVVDVKHRAIITQTHFYRYRQYHVRLSFLIFFSGLCRCETDTCLSSTPGKESVRKLALGVFSQDTTT